MQTFSYENKCVRLELYGREDNIHRDDVDRIIGKCRDLNVEQLQTNMESYVAIREFIKKTLDEAEAQYKFTGSGALTGVTPPHGTYAIPLHGAEDIDIVLEVQDVGEMLKLLEQISTSGHFCCDSIFTGLYYDVKVDVRMEFQCAQTLGSSEFMYANSYNKTRSSVFEEPVVAVTHETIGKLYSDIRSDSDSILLLGMMKAVCGQKIPGWLLATAVAFGRKAVAGRMWCTNTFLVQSEATNIFLQMIGYGKTIKLGDLEMGNVVNDFMGLFGDAWTQHCEDYISQLDVTEKWDIAKLTSIGIKKTTDVRARAALPPQGRKTGGSYFENLLWIHENPSLGCMVRAFFEKTLTSLQLRKVLTFFGPYGTFYNITVKLGLANFSYGQVPVTENYNASFAFLRFMVIWFGQRITGSEKLHRRHVSFGFLEDLVLKGANKKIRVPNSLAFVFKELDMKLDRYFSFWFFRQQTSKVADPTLPNGSNDIAIDLVARVLDHLPSVEAKPFDFTYTWRVTLGTNTYICDQHYLREPNYLDEEESAQNMDDFVFCEEDFPPIDSQLLDDPPTVSLNAAAAEFVPSF